MDGVSVVLAVLPLGIQLVNTIRKANKFLKEVQNAPEGWARLIDTLDQLESFLIAVNGLIERQEKVGSLPGSVHLMSAALQRCETTAKKLEASTDGIKTYLKSQGRGRRAWASLKTVVKKEEVEGLRKQIEEDMMYLQNALTLNTNHLQLYQIEHVSTHLPPNTSTQCVSSKTLTSIHSGSKWEILTGSTFKSEVTDVWRYNWFLGNSKLRKETKFLRTHRNSRGEIINEEKCLIVAPSFLRVAVEMRYCGGFFGLPRSLNFFPVLDLYEKVLPLCELGNLEDFQQALSRREISPLARDSWGRTLLHYASALSNAKLCLLLIQMGVDPNHIDDYGEKAIYRVSGSVGSADESLRILVKAQDDLTSEDVSCIFNDWLGPPPEILDSLWSAYIFPDEVDGAGRREACFLGVALRQYGDGMREWGTWIRKWLRNKVDIHARISTSRSHRWSWRLYLLIRPDWHHAEMMFTPLDELFVLQDDPFKSMLDAHEWLLMLAEAGYDVDEYLKKERQLHSTQDSLTYRSFHGNIWRQLVFQIGENPKVYWDWWIDPSSPASFVSQEFRHMNPCHVVDYLSDWSSWEERWPFDYPLWSENFEPYPFGEDESRSSKLKSWQERADKAAKRYARQARKKYPADSQDNEKYSKIPGAWSEDEI